jgi:large subunit ribosomal protein L18
MKTKPTCKMPFRRRREGKTDYRLRLVLLKSNKPRLVVRRSLNYITAQIVEYHEVGDKTVASASSRQLEGMGWNFAADNTPAAYLTGLLIAKKAAEKGIKSAILDGGLYKSSKGSRIYAVVKGAIDGGLNVPVDEEVLPTKERLNGSHIAATGKFKGITEKFEKTKEAILGGVQKEIKKVKASGRRKG